MRKLSVAVAAVLAAAAVTIGVANASGDGGTVIGSGFACGVLDGNGAVFITTDSVLIAYQTKVVLRCTGDGAAAKELTYFTYANTGLTCAVPGYGSTTNWTDKVGRSGNSQLVCVVSTDSISAQSSSGAAGLG